MTLKETLKKHQGKRYSVSCKNGKYYHYFRKKDELDKLADLEVIDTFTQELKGQHLFEKGSFIVKELALVIDKFEKARTRWWLLSPTELANLEKEAMKIYAKHEKEAH